MRILKIDLVIDLHFLHWSYLRIAIFGFLLRNLIRPKIKIKCYRPSLKYLLKDHKSEKHVLNFYYEALKKANIDLSSEMPELFIAQEEKEWLNSYLRSHCIEDDDLIFGVCPGASYKNKRWQEENFRKICMYLCKKPKVKIILFAKEDEKKIVEYIGEGFALNKLICAIELPLKKLIPLMKKCTVILTNDSGLMHVGSALGVPTIAIFGPTHPRLGYYPLGDKNIIFHSDIPCSPCSRWGEKKCLYKRQLCFENISIENVLKALDAKYRSAS